MGYLRNPVKTASEFTDDDWLKSGDIGYIDKVDNIVMGPLCFVENTQDMFIS